MTFTLCQSFGKVEQNVGEQRSERQLHSFWVWNCSVSQGHSAHKAAFESKLTHQYMYQHKKVEAQVQVVQK